jgi:hypothetical protein
MSSRLSPKKIDERPDVFLSGLTMGRTSHRFDQPLIERVLPFSYRMKDNFDGQRYRPGQLLWLLFALFFNKILYLKKKERAR